MSEQEVGQNGTASSPGSIEPPGPDVLLRGTVAPYRLGEVLLRIGELKLTGRLSLASDMGKRTILFHSGFPVFTQSSLFAERLGAVGVRHGFFSREDVARALSHARDHRVGLGESLLELGYMKPTELYALLGVQLREVVAASCGGAPQRARFQSGGAALRDVVILKLHPMTALLAAVASLPAEEQSRLLLAVADRKLVAAPVPALVRQWLADLGYMGDSELLLQGEPPVSQIRSRLLVRHRAEAERMFDPAQVRRAFAGTRVMATPLTPASVADLVTLTLLLSGALRLLDAPAVRSNPARLLSSIGQNLQMALDGAVDRSLTETQPSTGGAGESPADGAVETYLNAKRERPLAAASAVWGPGVEAFDESVPSEILRLYLTLKPEQRPEVVLDVAKGASPEQVMQAYARRAELVASLGQGSGSEHAQSRIAELAQRIDDALERLLPGSARASLPPPAIERPASEPARAAAATPERTSSREPSAEASASAARAGVRVEALAAKVEALLRAGHWRAVLDALEARASDPKLPFTLQLARAMAQRELETRPEPRRGSPSWVVALIAGLLIGLLLGHFAGAWAAALGIQF